MKNIGDILEPVLLTLFKTYLQRPQTSVSVLILSNDDIVKELAYFLLDSLETFEGVDRKTIKCCDEISHLLIGSRRFQGIEASREVFYLCTC